MTMNAFPLSQEKMRDQQQLYFDDVEIGHMMPELVIGPLSTTHFFRWSAAIENWHRIHYDQNFAIYHEQLPNVLGQGSWKQSILMRFLKDICLPDGWAWKVSFQHRAMIVPGDTMTVWATVTGKTEQQGLGVVTLHVGMRLQTAAETCPGTAVIVLPVRGGRAIPHPFVPPAA